MSHKQTTGGYYQQPSVPTQTGQKPGPRFYTELLDLVHDHFHVDDKCKRILADPVFINWVKNPKGDQGDIVWAIFFGIVKYSIESRTEVLEYILNPGYSLSSIFRRFIVDHINTVGNPILARLMGFSRVGCVPLGYDERKAAVLKILLKTALVEWQKQHGVYKPQGHEPSHIWQNFVNGLMHIWRSDPKNGTHTVQVRPLVYALVESCLPATAAVLLSHGASLQDLDLWGRPTKHPTPDGFVKIDRTPNLERFMFIPGNDMWRNIPSHSYRGFLTGCWNATSQPFNKPQDKTDYWIAVLDSVSTEAEQNDLRVKDVYGRDVVISAVQLIEAFDFMRFRPLIVWHRKAMKPLDQRLVRLRMLEKEKGKEKEKKPADLQTHQDR